MYETRVSGKGLDPMASPPPLKYVTVPQHVHPYKDIDIEPIDFKTDINDHSLTGCRVL